MEDKSLIDYTKYQLKPGKEIVRLLAGIESIQVIICEKCYSGFDSDPCMLSCQAEKDLLSFGAGISSIISMPFLCNTRLSSTLINRLDTAIPVGVVSCGIGIQSVAALLQGKKVIALADSMPHGGNVRVQRACHGIALGEEKCAACGECWLEATGGICPVVNCAKGLLNGPCGGADRMGACEVNPGKRCAWIEIFERLGKQGRKPLFLQETRNYNSFPPDRQESISIINREKRMEGFYGGVHPGEKKGDVSGNPIEIFPPPEKLFIFLSQHTGLPARPIVGEGEKVRMGQKIGESGGFISSPVHSGVSGKVLSIEERIHPVSGLMSPAIIIENDGLETPDDSIYPLEGWESLDKKEVLEFLREKGVVGMGGAMFPSAVKLAPPGAVDTLLVNGCECEPYLSGDNRLMVEHAGEIVRGASLARKLLGAGDIFYCIEENKKEALESMKASAENPARVIGLRTKYPQGAEKMLIRRTLGRNVPDGKLPFDVGAVVLNVGTAYAIYRAVSEGMPLFERVVTVAGDGVSRRGNFLMKTGTPFAHVAGKCFTPGSGLKDFEIRMGGPMMGIIQRDLSSAVIKGTTGLLCMRKSPAEASESRDCIKCGRCVDACPMELYPHYYAYYGKNGAWGKCLEYGVKKCIECGCCQYICSSRIDLLSHIKKAKKNADNKT